MSFSRGVHKLGLDLNIKHLITFWPNTLTSKTLKVRFYLHFKNNEFR
jgi:hypothetical protein